MEAQAAGSDEESDSSESSGKSDSSKDSSSSFGCQSPSPAKQKKSAAKKAATKPKTRAKGPDSDGAPKKPRPGQADAKSQAAAAKEASVLDSGPKAVSLLQELAVPSVMWRSVVRVTEVDRRLGKADSLCSEIEEICCTIDGDGVEERKTRLLDLKKKLENERKHVSALRDLCKRIRNFSSEEAADEVAKIGSIKYEFSVCYKSLLESEGTLVEMIQSVAKKIIDVFLDSNNGNHFSHYNTLYFDYFGNKQRLLVD